MNNLNNKEKMEMERSKKEHLGGKKVQKKLFYTVNYA